MGDRPVVKSRRSRQKTQLRGERAWLTLDDGTRQWLTPWTGRGVVDRIRELVRDAHTWFGLPQPALVVLEADREQLGLVKQRDYVLSMLLRRARELGVASGSVGRTSPSHDRQSAAASTKFCCLLEPGTRSALHAGRWLGECVEGIIDDARTFYGVSPRVRDALLDDMRQLRIESQRDYIVWLLLQRLIAPVTLTRGPSVGRVA